MRRASVLTVTLNPAMDKTLIVPGFSHRRVIRVERSFSYPSGKGINVARSLIRLGLSTLCLGFIAGHIGRWIEEELDREGIPHRFTRVEGETRVNITLRDPLSGLEIHLVERGFEVDEADVERFMKGFSFHLGGGVSWAAICGSAPPGVPHELYAEMIAESKRRGVKAALDTSGGSLKAGLKGIPDLVKPNREELGELMGGDLTGMEALLGAVSELHAMGIRWVAVSLGEEGALGSDGREVWLARPPEVEPVNTVGAGDAMLAGLIFGLESEMGIDEALAFGVAVGTESVLEDGPCYTDPERVGEILKKVKLERVRSC